MVIHCRRRGSRYSLAATRVLGRRPRNVGSRSSSLPVERLCGLRRGRLRSARRVPVLLAEGARSRGPIRSGKLRADFVDITQAVWGPSLLRRVAAAETEASQVVVEIPGHLPAPMAGPGDGRLRSDTAREVCGCGTGGEGLAGRTPIQRVSVPNRRCQRSLPQDPIETLNPRKPRFLLARVLPAKGRSRCIGFVLRDTARRRAGVVGRWMPSPPPELCLRGALIPRGGVARVCWTGKHRAILRGGVGRRRGQWGDVRRRIFGLWSTCNWVGPRWDRETATVVALLPVALLNGRGGRAVLWAAGAGGISAGRRLGGEGCDLRRGRAGLSHTIAQRQVGAGGAIVRHHHQRRWSLTEIGRLAVSGRG